MYYYGLYAVVSLTVVLASSCTISSVFLGGAGIPSPRSGEGGALDIMHDRRRMSIDPRIPAMPGRSMGGGGVWFVGRGLRVGFCGLVF